jgi:hypothetical protein
MTNLAPTFVEVLYDDTYQNGPRFVTAWSWLDRKFVVSSVDHDWAKETMVFPMHEDGEVNYIDLWADLEFRSTKEQHESVMLRFMTERTFTHPEDLDDQ